MGTLMKAMEKILVPTDEGKDILDKHKELIITKNRIKDLIRSKIINSGNYDKKCMKIKFNSNDDLTQNKKAGFHNIAIAVRSVFHKKSEYYVKVFLNECLYKL